MTTPWIQPNQANFYGHWLLKNGREAVEYYNQKYAARTAQHPHSTSSKYEPYVKDLKEKGYAKIENFFDKEFIAKMREDTENLIKTGQSLKIHNEEHSMIAQPLYNIEGATQIAFDDRIIEMASSFYGCLPAIGTCNLRKSYANNLPSRATNLFHRDFNSVRIIKFFAYLNDVDIHTGPFTYVEGSNAKMFSGWDAKQRWMDAELENAYSKQSIKRCTAKAGDLLMGWTNGWHKGQKVRKGSRLMFTINFVIHPELADGKEQDISFKIKKSFYDSLPDRKKPVCDFLLKE
tara:strand:+ start:3671 stop:4540 length:870 start_codon:yes stop_codon:yes gene_type:complete